MTLIGELRDAVQRSLDNQLIDNAVFLGEQLYHHDSSDDNAVLLAKCYMRQNQPVVGG
jgi:hypothetical protein